MSGSGFQPVRRSRRGPERRRITTFEAVCLILAVFVSCVTALAQFPSEVAHLPPGEVGRGSLVGPAIVGAVIAAPALVSLALRRLLRRG